MARLTLAITLVSTAVAQQTFWQDSFQLNFNYDPESQRGPTNWDSISVSNSEWDQYASGNPVFNLDINGNECGQRIRPSPIMLETTTTCTDSHEMLTRQISSTDCNATAITFELTPHTLRAYFPEDDSTCQRPTIEMDGSDSDPFILQWMEIHARSEHVVDGRRFDAELQMVHMGTNNDNNKMAIVSIMIDASARADHVDFQYLLDQWQAAANDQTTRCGTTRSLRRRDNKIQLAGPGSEREEKEYPSQARRTQQQQCTGTTCGPRRKMYPYSMWPSIWYFKYAGSLTTPPCSAIVNWRVLDKQMMISRKQYKQLATLLTAYKDGNCQDDTVLSPHGENFRPLISINTNNQDVAHCTKDDFDYTLFDPSQQ